MMNRREMISLSMKGAALVGLAGLPAATCAAARQPYMLDPLPYPFDALEPHIDARTMEIHHGRHHQAYVNNLNAALADSPLLGIPIDDLMRRIGEVPADIRTRVIDNGGGHANHAFFWSILRKPGQWNEPARGPFYSALLGRFQSPVSFYEQFDKAAMSVFGSGWAWLVVDADKQLSIMTTPNQESPLMTGKTPLLGLDVWEHAYYLKHQNRRADYVRSFWSVLNWEDVDRRYRLAIS